MRFLGRPFTEFYIPTIEEFHRLKYIVAGHTYQLDVLDTPGQTLNPTMQNLTLLTGKYIYLYMIKQKSSFEIADFRLYLFCTVRYSGHICGWRLGLRPSEP